MPVSVLPLLSKVRDIIRKEGILMFCVSEDSVMSKQNRKRPSK